VAISFSSSGDFKQTETFLLKMSRGDLFSRLDRYGKIGVDALSKATPRDSGKTAGSWGYRIIKSRINPGIEWYNDNVEDGVNVAILIQYGHGTGTGGYVQGKDYINPAIKPIFDKLSQDIWEEVKS
jgi:hypothetical protein